jgi:hypothetical protein
VVDNRRGTSQRERWLAAALCLAVVTGSVAASFFGGGRRPIEGAGSTRSAALQAVGQNIEPPATRILAQGREPAAPNGVHNLVPELTAACQDDQPYFVTVCYPSGSDMAPRSSPSVVIFRDTPADQPQYVAAFFRDLGAIYGLAYSANRGTIYASSYRKYGLPTGPSGPGSIYRIDIATGEITTLVTLPDVGPNSYEAGIGAADPLARRFATKVDIGDIDLDEAEGALFAMNLGDRRIYRIDPDTGSITARFDHGASGTDWADEARPFGLMTANGLVYHGVVRSGELGRQRSLMTAHVYESAPDGSAMREAASFSLDYARGFTWVVGGAPLPLRWNPWVETPTRNTGNLFATMHPMPILADLGFEQNGVLVLGLRDRHTDTAPNFMSRLSPLPGQTAEPPGVGIGDLLAGTPNQGRWDVVTVPEHFIDAGMVTDESIVGSVAVWGTIVVVGALEWSIQNNVIPVTEQQAIGYDISTGNKLWRERLCSISSPAPRRLPINAPDDNEWGVRADMGDIEVLCGEAWTPTPTPTITPTPSITPTPFGTATSTPTPTSTASATASPSPSATREILPAYLPIAISEEPCPGDMTPADIVLVLDTSTSMLELPPGGRSKLVSAVEAAELFLTFLRDTDRAALVTFNETATLDQPLTADPAELSRALGAVSVGQFTRIDLGIRVAMQELEERGRAGARRTMLVLTDGRNNPEPSATVVEAARVAAAADVRIISIGLGSDADVDLLVAIASAPTDFHFAPDGEALAEIYRLIGSVLIPCPDLRFWPHDD